MPIIYGVIGPDEYHESVDDNAYTNVMARWNLRPRRRADGTGIAIDAGERRRWLELADALVDGYDPDTGIYEQFAGFGRLEPLIIGEVAPRRPIAADLLLGAERVAGAQVIKQADVLMLHHLVPDEVVPGSLEPNLRYYEPRTAHGSSLSPATHASLQARARDFDRALESLRLAARMDLDDLTGSTARRTAPRHHGRPLAGPCLRFRRAPPPGRHAPHRSGSASLVVGPRAARAVPRQQGPPPQGTSSPVDSTLTGAQRSWSVGRRLPPVPERSSFVAVTQVGSRSHE